MHDRLTSGGRLGPIEWAVRSSAWLATGIVGYRIPEIRPASVVPIRAGDLIVIAGDGIAHHPVEVILRERAEDTDDVMVLTARHRGTTR